MRRLRHVLFGHDWPEVWTKYGTRSLVPVPEYTFDVFEKVCPCGARQTMEGPARWVSENH